jgi:hypothetical protein
VVCVLGISVFLLELNMSPIDKAVALSRADAATPPAEDKMDKLLAGIGIITARMDSDERARKDSDEKMMTALDSMAKRLDACEADMKARKDAEDEKARKDAAESEEKCRKDAEEKEEKEKKERADAEAKDKEEKERADAAARGSATPDVLAQIKALEARIPAVLSDADRALFVGAQVKAERVAQAFGDSEGAPRWMNGETLPDYQRRLLGKYKAHSAAWKDKDLARVDASVLDVAETQIYADAITAASAPSSVAPGTLRVEVTPDDTGRRIRRFHGDPEVTWGPFKQPLRSITGVRTNFTHA